MTQTVSDTFVTASGPTNGAQVTGYLASRFSTPPVLNSPPPGSYGADTITVTTSTEFGGPGQFRLPMTKGPAESRVPTNEPFYLSFTYNGQVSWKYYSNVNAEDGGRGNIGIYGLLDGQGYQAKNFQPGTQPSDLATVSQIVFGNQGNQGATGSQGPQGDQGPQGPQGVQGSNATAPYLYASDYGVSASNTDNTTQLQAWLDAVNTTHRTGWIDAGTYKYAGTLQFYSNMLLRGSASSQYGAQYGSILRYTGTGGRTTTSASAALGATQVAVNAGTLDAGSSSSPLIGTIETQVGNQSISYYVSSGILYLTTGSFVGAISSGAQVWNKAINASSTHGVTLYDLTFTFDKPAFGGVLLDFSGGPSISSHIYIYGGNICGFYPSNYARLLNFNNSYTVSINGVKFSNAYCAIEGCSSTSGANTIIYNYVNGMTIKDCHFDTIAGATIFNPGESCTIINPTVEPGFGLYTSAGVPDPAFLTTSSTTLTMSTGSKTLTVGTGLSYVANQPIRLYNSFNSMTGTVTSYSSSSLVVSIDTVNGSGTYSSWTVTPNAVANFITGNLAGSLNDACSVIGGWIGDAVGGSWITWQGGSLNSTGVLYGYQSKMLTLTSDTSAVSITGGSISAGYTSGSSAIDLGNYAVKSFVLQGVAWPYESIGTPTRVINTSGIVSTNYESTSGTHTTDALIGSSFTVSGGSAPNLATANDAYQATVNNTGTAVSLNNATFAYDSSVILYGSSGSLLITNGGTGASFGQGGYLGANWPGTTSATAQYITVTPGLPYTATITLKPKNAAAIASPGSWRIQENFQAIDALTITNAVVTGGNLITYNFTGCSTGLASTLSTTSIPRIAGFAYSALNSGGAVITSVSAIVGGAGYFTVAGTGLTNGTYTALASGWSYVGTNIILQVTYSSYVAISGSGQTQLSVTVTAPAGATHVRIGVYSNGTTQPSGATMNASKFGIFQSSSNIWTAPGATSTAIVSSTGISGGGRPATNFGTGVSATDLATVAQLPTATGLGVAPFGQTAFGSVTATSGGAATVSINYGTTNVTNFATPAATVTITMTTSGAIDGQVQVVRFYDSTAASKILAWVNTENSTVSVPLLSAGSTTLPTTVTFQYNAATSKWRCIASV